LNFAEILDAIWDQAAERGWLTLIIPMSVHRERNAAIFKLLTQQSWMRLIAAGYYLAPSEWIYLNALCLADLAV
jgi:hypothetical protein